MMGGNKYAASLVAFYGSFPHSERLLAQIQPFAARFFELRKDEISKSSAHPSNNLQTPKIPNKLHLHSSVQPR
jgi:hypothetical protein